MKKKIFLFVTLIQFCVCTQAQVATADFISMDSIVMNNTNLLFGITFDARTGMTGSVSYGQVGYYQANGTMIPEVDNIFNDFPMSTLRYPANGVAVGFNWKKSIGAIGSRPNQNLLGALGGPQPVNFGFDEFMAMTEAKGVTGADVQIMISIYDSAEIGLTPTMTMAALPNIIRLNADWVEYANAPNDGSNPGGGIDWAVQRAANGHPNPYGIKIWNIGNEPWSTLEDSATNTGCTRYLNRVTPIIDSMLAIDPTLKITLPTTGNPTNPNSWAYTILNSTLVSSGKIYALSQHYFPTENTVGVSPPIQGVQAVNTNLTNLVNAAAAKGIKVFVGDYAHYITSVAPSNAQKDSAMQWLGANMEADFLLMLSQMGTIERCNFWAYGMPYAVWHPIRINAIGNYTLMPAAKIYKKLFPAFLDYSIKCSSTSPAGSDNNPYAVRTGMFASTDLNQLNIVAVNRDKNNTVSLKLGNLPNFTILNLQTIYTASALNSDSIFENQISVDANGDYVLPPMSILVVEYLMGENISNLSKTQSNMLYPNPGTGLFYFREPQVEVEVYNAIGQRILSQSEKGKTINLTGFPNGLYFIRTDSETSKIMLEK